MIDTVPSFRSPLYDDAKPKKLPASFYWGVLFAVLLHLALLYYFFNQTFSLAPVEAVPDGPTYTVEILPLPTPPAPTPQEPPASKVVIHDPVKAPPTTVETLPVPPTLGPKVENGPVSPPTLQPTITGGTDVQPTLAPAIVQVRWTRFPDSAALSDYYPEKAATAEVEGTAMVECTVLDKAGRVACTPLSETPGNYGFGKATVRMVQEKGRVDTTQGDIAVGAKLRASIKWTLG
ncbi:energy transducer TonB [Asticcacaulis sp. 201]|uniref:energy transducer TonB n=1 Tax=Asticcacaulis sp. 201 TaxID=3028787 RepID=UPI002915E7D0|nr:energy transducer TonB [Asticcacaulis sp. 201]MDV6333038.1 energy transducer TonB [Asticcacaulis sp. 201]